MTAEYMPTADQRSLVESAAAFGLTQAHIAQQLKIDEKTLRKHFRDELSGAAASDLARTAAESPSSDCGRFPCAESGQAFALSHASTARSNALGLICLADGTRMMRRNFRVSVGNHRQHFGNCFGLGIPAL
jgi:hypothetical protein